MKGLATTRRATLPRSRPHRSRGGPSTSAMSALPRSLLHFGASVATARTSRRLRREGGALAAQEKTYKELIRSFASTAFGRENEIEARMPYDQFRTRVPLRVYEEFISHIERMKAGEAGVLWPGPCSFYAVSSGTTSGRTKYLPVTEAMLKHFRKAGADSLFYYSARVGHAGVFHGRHLFLGGSTTLAPLETGKSQPTYAGDLSGIAALNLPAWAESHLYEPGSEIAQMSDWQAKIVAIAERTVRRDITLVAGIPSWLLILAEAVLLKGGHGKARPTYLKAVWPNLECVVHGGVPLGPFAEELRAIVGPKVNFHEVYPASEGFIATQDADSTFGLRLMADVGLFFEFLPMKEFAEGKLGSLGPRAIPLAEVKEGEDYALILTTPAGLCRYVIGDVVRFVSTDVPRLLYVGRTRLQLSAFGEHVIEKELTDALLTVCHHHGWSIVNFHVAPLFVDSAASQNRGRHEWWIELKTPSAVTPTGPMIAAELDVELQQLNEDYEAKRKARGLEAPVVRLVMPGLFEQWMRAAGKWGGQGKMPRCRSDRHIAEELAKLARFSHDA